MILWLPSLCLRYEFLYWFQFFCIQNVIVVFLHGHQCCSLILFSWLTSFRRFFSRAINEIIAVYIAVHRLDRDGGNLTSKVLQQFIVIAVAERYIRHRLRMIEHAVVRTLGA